MHNVKILLYFLMQLWKSGDDFRKKGFVASLWNEYANTGTLA